LFIKLPDNDFPELLKVPGSHCVGEIKDDIIAKFKLDVAPQHMQLTKKDDGTPLNPTHDLSVAGISTGATLVVHLTAAGGENAVKLKRGCVTDCSTSSVIRRPQCSPFYALILLFHCRDHIVPSSSLP
jgi:hypothetical protein